MSEDRKQKAYKFGIAAEKYAAWYLRLKGYRILAERYRNSHGEIDLLAARGRDVVAVEVKARKNFQACHDAVAPWKQQKIMRAMQGLFSHQGKIAGLANIAERNIRFDVIWVVPWRLPRHIVDAWRM